MKRVGQVYRESLVSQIKQGVDKNKTFFLLSYSRLSASKVSEIRRGLKKVGADVSVSRNAIARIALKELEYNTLGEQLKEQTAFVWSNKDAVEISKVLVKYAKDYENLIIQGGVLEKQLLTPADVKKLSDLPSREVLLSQLLGTIQAPLSRLASALNAKTRDLLSILKQLSEKKGGN